MIDNRIRFAAMFVLLGACDGESATPTAEVGEKVEAAASADESPRVNRFDHLLHGDVTAPAAAVATARLAGEKLGVETVRDVSSTFSATLRDDALRAETQFRKAHGIAQGGER